RDPRTKLFLTYRALHFRRDHQQLFAEGDYIPLSTHGELSEQVCSFARRLGPEWVGAVAPRWLARLGCAARSPHRLAGFSPRLDLAKVERGPAPLHWVNVITDRAVESLSIADLLRDFPVALLYGRTESLA